MTPRNGIASEVLSAYNDGDYLSLAGVVAKHERMAAEINQHDITWESRTAGEFDTPIALERVKYHGGKPDTKNFWVSSAIFHVFGDDEMMLQVTRDNLDFVQSDPLSIDALAAFTQSYVEHTHTTCLVTLRQRREQELAKKHQNEEALRVKRRGSFVVKLNGITQDI